MMELVGQHEIAAHPCGQVNESVCRAVFHARVPKDDLPSDRSVGPFVDMGQALATLHVADELSKCDRFDIHNDATTKAGKKFVGQQVTTDSVKTLACGFTVVASETADYLVDVRTSLLEELAVVSHSGAEQHEKFMEFVQEVSGLMSDQTAVMKCFNTFPTAAGHVRLQ